MSSERAAMIRDQLEGRGLRDERVLSAMAEVPREAFVPPEKAHLAYADAPLPIGEDQTISQPYVVARMVELADLAPDDRVLDVGAGSGYQTAVLAALCRTALGLELRFELAERARATLARLGVKNAEIVTGDGHRGVPERGPYDAILIAAATEEVPGALFEQLAEGGRLIAPVGPLHGQELVRYRKRDGEIGAERFGSVRFIPFVRSSVPA